MKITLKSIHIENFKGITSKDISFSETTAIRGANASGKTTIVDAFLWLLFDKNSQYATDFEIRPLDKDGNPIHMTDITVSALIDFDGVEHELKKVQRENWVKQRGTETAVFKGNVNSFEIDGYPKSLAEYKAFVESIVSEDKFKIITNPTFFPNMKWKEQREILMKFVSTDSDVALAERFGGYDDILDELRKAPSTDDILKKFKNAKKDLELKLKELPVRIDEVSKTKVDYDLAELELAKTDIEKKIAQAISDNTGDVEEYKKELMEIEFAKSNLATSLNSDNVAKRYELKNKLNEVNSRINAIENDISVNNRGIETEKKLLELDIESMNKMGADYYAKKEETFDESKWTYDEKSEYCNVCGQILPVSQIERVREEFAKRKANAVETFNATKKYEMQTLVDRGNAIKSKIEESKKHISERETKVVEYNVAIESAKVEKSVIEQDILKIPESVNLLENREYKSLVEKEMELKDKIRECEERNLNFSMANTELERELVEVNSKIAQANNNTKIDERIDELRTEQRTVSQNVANCEKVIYLVEQFVKAKLDSISVMINSNFTFVNFKLFDVAINGGISECCEITVDGVPYSSLNSACKIQAGLDIINAFSDTYNVSAPVFIDNRESCTWIPEVKSQVISLYVDPSHNYLFVESGDK